MFREASGAPLLLAIESQCSSDDEAGPREPVPSSYVATYQQLTNPDYVAAQSALQQAQRRLAELKLQHALNPPVGAWAGAAAGLQEGLASNAAAAAERRLAETPPFIQRPVSAPYTAYKQTHTRTAQVVLRLKLQDTNSSFKDATEITMQASSSADEITGVMASDQNGLQNRRPVLEVDSSLFAEALKVDHGSTSTGLRAMLQRALIQRAVATPSTDRARRLGTLLLAFDIDPSADPVSEFREFKKVLDETPLERVLTMDFKNPAVVPTRPASNRALPAATSRTRPAIVAEALDATLTVRHSKGSGTGFVISANGLLVTNAHVIEGAKRLTATTTSGDEYLLTVVSTDALRDLALLRLTGWSGHFLEFGDSDAIAAGEEVLAVGSPLGLEGTATRGIVSAKRRIDGVGIIQIDAAINPGSSGGPLLDISGRVVGVTSWKITGQRTESIGFAVAASEVRNAFGTLLPH
jgi:S1-C subfamily serine protease